MTVIVTSESELVVPRSVRRRAGIKTGDQVEFKVSGGVINIVPRLPSANDAYTPEQRLVIDRDLAAGLDDIKHGRLQGPFVSHKEFIASLHKEDGKLSTKKTKRPLRSGFSARRISSATTARRPKNPAGF